MNIRALGSNNQLFHVNRINQSAARINGTAGNLRQQNQDRLALTPEGKKQSLLDNLMKQKQSIIERKSELKASNAENGGSASTIEAQLEMMDEQLKNIDEQIATARTEELETEKKDEEGTIYEKPKTEAEAAQDKLSSITEMSRNLDSIEVVASVKANVDGRIQVLKTEANSGFGNKEAKLKQIAELETESNDLTALTGNLINDVSESLEAVNQTDSTVDAKEQRITSEEILKASDEKEPANKEIKAENEAVL